MFKFSDVSKERLAMAHPALQDVFNEIINFVNIGITCSVRTVEEQKRLVADGKSQTMNSYHIPIEGQRYSRAVDIVWYSDFKGDYVWSSNPYRIIGPAVVELGRRKGYIIRWGGDWDRDGDQRDQSFMDLVHFEYRGKI